MDSIKMMPATSSDREEILKLYKAQLGRDYCPWNDEYPDMCDVDADIESDNCFVMKNSEGRILAVIAIDNFEETEKLPYWNPALNPGGELSRLAVLPSEQCKGYSREMIKYVMGILKERGCKAARMLVNCNNLKALRSYAKLNFANVGECDMFEQHFICFEKEL